MVSHSRALLRADGCYPRDAVVIRRSPRPEPRASEPPRGFFIGEALRQGFSSNARTGLRRSTATRDERAAANTRRECVVPQHSVYGRRKYWTSSLQDTVDPTRGGRMPATSFVLCSFSPMTLDLIADPPLLFLPTATRHVFRRRHRRQGLDRGG